MRTLPAALAVLTLCMPQPSTPQSSTPQSASQDFKPSARILGDLRIRAEADGRDFDLSSPANSYTTMRIRVGVEARPAQRVRVLVTFRDWRVFGTETDATGAFNTISDTKNVDIHQGFVEVQGIPAEGVMLRAGRQELGYGNERMVGGVGWNNIGRVFDGALLRYAGGPVTADLFGMTVAEVQTYPFAATPATTAPVPDDGLNFFGLYVGLNSGSGPRADAYVLYQGNRLQSNGGFIDFRRVTAGGLIRGKEGRFVYDAEAAWQGGERGDAGISAYTLTGMAGYEPEGSAVSRVSAGYEYLSGTPPGDPDVRTFDPPYATGHKFHGFMDYFTNIPVQTGNRGLVDLIGRVDLAPHPSIAASAVYHGFRMAESGGEDDLFGHELDLMARYRMVSALSFDCGFSIFLPGPAFRGSFGGADAGLWGYVATTVVF